VTSPVWGEEFCQAVVWLSGRDGSRAELALTPPELGRVEVSITVDRNGETNLLFVAESQRARDAIEASLPRLREHFADAGIALGQAGVHSDSTPRDGAESRTATLEARSERVAELVDKPLASLRLAGGRGLVDTFA
jgi:flagellar hook-length control protein FliK